MCVYIHIYIYIYREREINRERERERDTCQSPRSLSWLAGPPPPLPGCTRGQPNSNTSNTISNNNYGYNNELILRL